MIGPLGVVLPASPADAAYGNYSCGYSWQRLRTYSYSATTQFHQHSANGLWNGIGPTSGTRITYWEIFGYGTWAADPNGWHNCINI